MFCTNCGSKIDDTALFCTQCGTPTNLNQTVASAQKPAQPSNNEPITNEHVPVKKKKGKLLIIAGACIAIILAGGVTGFFLYQNNIIKQADNVLAYQNEGKYEDAIALYEKHSGKKEEFDSKVYDGLRNVAKQIKDNYYFENIDYNTAKEQLSLLKKYNITKLNNEVKDISVWVDSINISRENYKDGIYYYEQGDYLAALEKLNSVLQEDNKYYEMAIKEINHIEQVIAERQEQERIDEIREKALADAANYADSYNYEMAINTIEQGLSLIPNDPELTEQLSLYNEYYKMYIRVPNFTSSIYEHTYNEQDKDIMTVSMELPILEGYNPAYSAINEFFEYIKLEYISSNDQTVDEAIWYLNDNINDENFTPYEFNINYNVLYNNNGVLCVSLDGYVYTGGAHPFPIKDVFTFDLRSGSILNLSDLLVTDTETFSNYVREEFQRMYDEAPDEYWEDAPYTVYNDSANINNWHYYLYEDEICIFYYPYDLGSYAREFVEIIVPYAGNEWMFSFLN